MDLNDYGKFWMIDPTGNKILRDLKRENDSGFTIEKYRSWDGFDDFNYMFFENYEFNGDDGDYECTGSDYERLGCTINPGDIVVDIGANIGMFSRWAHLRGASRIISFEPVSLTFSCLIDNLNGIAECHKVAVGPKTSSVEMFMPDRNEKFYHLGGGTMYAEEGKSYAKKEICISMSISELFEIGILPERIDFLKIDCEGAEKEIIESISDKDLLRIEKISMEYHHADIGPEYRDRLLKRMENLGYNHFTLIHGSGDLRQVHIWRNK